MHLVNPHSVLAPSKRYRPIDVWWNWSIRKRSKETKICRRIMLFLSNINSECSIPGSVSLQPKQPLATWKCFTNQHPMICEAGTDISKTYPQITSHPARLNSATSRISNPELWFQPHSNMYWSFRIIRHVPKRKHKTSLKPPVNPRSGKLLIQ